jgi:hypothetical protein
MNGPETRTAAVAGGRPKISGTILQMRTRMFSRFALMNKKIQEVGLGS